MSGGLTKRGACVFLWGSRGGPCRTISALEVGGGARTGTWLSTLDHAVLNQFCADSVELFVEAMGVCRASSSQPGLDVAPCRQLPLTPCVRHWAVRHGAASSRLIIVEKELVKCL